MGGKNFWKLVFRYQIVPRLIVRHFAYYKTTLIINLLVGLHFSLGMISTIIVLDSYLNCCPELLHKSKLNVPVNFITFLAL